MKKMSKVNKIKLESDKQYFIKRLNIIEGQIRGLKGMIENNREYEEILIQLGALTNSLRGVGTSIVENYMQYNLDNKEDAEEIKKLYDKLV